MSFASSPVRQALVEYVAGRAKPDRLVATVMSAYYRETGGGGSREYLRPVVEVIERAAPGVVELAGKDGGAGFDIRLAERLFPRQYEAELRSAAQAVLRATWPESAGPGTGGGDEGRGGLVGRLVRALQRLFTASV